MTAVAFYGRTYLDAEVEIAIGDLSTGKGKVDVPVRVELGGFPCNAARAVLGRLAPSDVTIVTKISSLDLPRLRAAVPPSTSIVAIDTGAADFPPVTVIVNPASDCRLLRAGTPGDLCAADFTNIAGSRGAEVPRGADLAIATDVPRATLHVFGRVASDLVAYVRSRAPVDAVLAWCGGATDPDSLHACDLACVNTAEARELTGREATGTAPTTHELASLLAERAPAGGIRVVTGRGDAPTVAAIRDAAGIRTFEKAPAPVAREQIRRLKGVGDVFATRLFVDAVFDERGVRRPAIDIEAGLAAAQSAAAAFMIAGPR